MRKIYLISFALLLLSCNTKPDTKSLLTAPDRPEYTLAQQQKVLGDIKFGINEVEFKKLYKSFLKSKKCGSDGCKIGTFDYSHEFASFDQGKLYMLQLHNTGWTYSYYDDFIPTLIDNAYKAIKQEYGEPTETQAIPSWTSIRELTAHDIKVWNVGDKVIKVNIDLINGYYGVSIIILNLSAYHAANEKRELLDSLRTDSLNKLDKGTL